MDENWKTILILTEGAAPAWKAKYRGPDGEWCTVRDAHGPLTFTTEANAAAQAQAYAKGHHHG